MGAYLSSPVTEKISCDESSARLSFGASSMQGWRVSQEDAHNCIIDFDEDTSFFAVYDGHGGAEVAKYCSLHFPDCFRSVVSYKNGNISQALEEAFLEFDNCLTKPEVIDELKHLSAVSDDSEDEDTVAEDARALHEEARMPLVELLSRYKGAPLPLKVAPHVRNYHTQMPKSPMLHAKKSLESSEGSQMVNGDDCPQKVDCDGDREGGDVKETAANGNEECESEVQQKENKEGKGDGSTSEEVSSTLTLQPKPKEDLPQPGCSHPKEKRPKGAKVEQKEPISGSEDDDEDDDDEEYMIGESDDEDKENEDGDDAEEEEEEDDEEESSEEEDSDDDEDARLELAENEEPGKDSGCTAVVAVLCGNQLYVANAGDSRCVVCRGSKAVDMSFDHKPEDQTERQRIEKAGGRVTADGRVNGGLNLSRAIGDHAYKTNEALGAKEQMISAQPDVQTLTVNPEEDRFMVLACDGIWNTMSSQEVVDFVEKNLQDGNDSLSSICEKLFDACLAPDSLGDGTGCDNMTCIVVRFHRPGERGKVSKRPSSPEEGAEPKKQKREEEAQGSAK